MIEETCETMIEDAAIERIAKLIKGAKAFALITVDDEESVETVYNGIEPGCIVQFLQIVARDLEEERAKAEAQRASSKKLQCPKCNAVVYIPKNHPQQAEVRITTDNSNTIAMCGCGTILIAFLNHDGSLRARLMAESEFLRLPPDLQIKLALARIAFDKRRTESK